MPTPLPLVVRQLGQCDYQPCLQAMQAFTDKRDDHTQDELWLLEHPAVFTQGLSGKAEHVLDPGDIPVIHIDRGGQVTYHGPGQLVVYCLFDLRRSGLGIRALVTALEQAVIDMLAAYQISAYNKCAAPGVYVAERKLASLGLRVRRGCCYHGLSLNIDMDLSPFQRINPCGYAGLQMTQLRDLGMTTNDEQIRQQLVQHLVQHLGYTVATRTDVYPVY